MKLLFLLVFLVSCGKVNHTVELRGEAVVKHTVDVEFCNSLPAEQQAECVEAVLRAISKDTESDEDDDNQHGLINKAQGRCL